MQKEDVASMFSWDQPEAASEEDFLADVDGQDVPKACSLDSPDCEACQ